MLEKWGAVIVNYFQGSVLRLPLGRKGREMWRGMVREGAVRRCRGGDSYSPLGENCYCGLNFARGASALNNKENLNGAKGFFLFRNNLLL